MNGVSRLSSYTKRAEPALSADKVVGVRLPSTVIALIDAEAKVKRETRSDVIRRLIAEHFRQRQNTPRSIEARDD